MSRPARRRRGRAWPPLSAGEQVVRAAMLLVPLVPVVIFIVLPALASLVLSATNWSGVGKLVFAPCDPTVPKLLRPGCFVGGDNYVEVVTNYPPFWPALQHNIIWLIVFLLIGTPLGMLLALVLNTNIRGSRVYQSILFIPVTLSMALVGIIWEFMYSPSFGFVNMALGRVGVGGVNWLGDPAINIWAVLIAACWRQAGYIMVLYLAGLKSLDPALHEAASIDGASVRQTFVHVTFPAMHPINVVVLVVTAIESLRAFDLVYIVNRGTNGLELLSVLVTQNIVGETQRVGLGSALGVILLVISIIPIGIFLRQTFRRTANP